MTGWRVAPAVGVHVVADDEETTVYAAHLPDGPIQVLTGVAAVVFTACAQSAADDLLSAVAEGLGVAEDELDLEALDDFLDELATAGLLVRPKG